jgi:hypothetical protein
VPPTPQAAAIEGPYRGTFTDIAFKPDDFGTGWTLAAQSVEPPDDSKVGTLQATFVGAGGVQVSTHLSVYRSRAAAQGAWTYANVSGGTLGVCDASWDPLGVADSDPTRGECLVQNVEAGASGASPSTLQTVLGRLARRVNDLSSGMVTATSTPVLAPGEVRFTGDPRSVALTEADYGGNWRLESDDASQLGNHEYSELFRKKDRSAAGMAVQVQVFDSAVTADARLRQFGVAQTAPADAGLADVCFEGVDPFQGPPSLQIACRTKNVTLFAGASVGADHALLVQLMQSMVARVSAQAH